MMIYQNTHKFYGSVTKSFHWLTAALIITLIPLGIIANRMAHQIKSDALADPALVQQTAFLFSLHKTLGVAVFFVAILRIVWALSHKKPDGLHPERKIETLLAETVHFTLYGALILVPLSGWVHHAASTGFAPIWWPFGQSLPFVAKSEGLSHTAASLHIIFERVLVLSLLLHIAGALKHHFIDRDSTLLRMLPGTPSVPDVPTDHKVALPAITAVLAYCAALGVGGYLGLFEQKQTTQVALLEAVETQWQVDSGDIGLTITQFGSQVSGSLADWTAAISFDRAVETGKSGTVDVTIAIPSLTLGSVTDQAMGPDFFDATTYPTATFQGDLITTDDGHIAQGTLTIRDQSMPLTFDFQLSGDAQTQTATAQFSLSRLDFGVGSNMPDESSLAFAVDVDVSLTATQNE